MEIMIRILLILALMMMSWRIVLLAFGIMKNSASQKMIIALMILLMMF